MSYIEHLSAIERVIRQRPGHIVKGEHMSDIAQGQPLVTPLDRRTQCWLDGELARFQEGNRGTLADIIDAACTAEWVTTAKLPPR